MQKFHVLLDLRLRGSKRHERRRLIQGAIRRLLLAIIWTVIMVTGLVLVRDHDQNVRERMERLEENESDRMDLEHRKQALMKHLDALDGDPVAIEEALRRKLRWTRSGEVVLLPVIPGDTVPVTEREILPVSGERYIVPGEDREKRLDISQVNP